MLLHLEDILPEGIEIEVNLDPDDPALREFDIKGPVTGSFQIGKTGSQVLVKGSVSGEVSMACARCLSDIVYRVDEPVDLVLRSITDLENTAQEMELGPDDLNVEHFRGDALDIYHLIAEQISLALPMKPLCRADCGGLCPDCGAAGGECRCRPRIVDPRFTALQELKERMEKKKR
ncbi:MAG: YceD family protein [bacterium]|nr:YceD family protein [bacterium]